MRHHQAATELARPKKVIRREARNRAVRTVRRMRRCVHTNLCKRQNKNKTTEHGREKKGEKKNKK